MAEFAVTKIKNGLVAHLKDLIIIPDMDIAWPGVSFKNPPAVGYLRATFLPNTTGHLFFSNSDGERHVGLFQVDVLWPQGCGEIEPTEKAGTIINHFGIGTKINHDGIVIRIENHPSLGPALKSDPYMLFPVSIPYIVDV